MEDSQRRDAALFAAVNAGLLGKSVFDADQTVEDKPLGIFFDVGRWEENLALLREKAFSEPHFLHACAVKTNPLEFFLRRALELGHGAECASISEVIHALELGFEARNVVYDSPCKTLAEIKFALSKGVHLNIDNLQELERVKQCVQEMQVETNVGIRVNPLVGAGTIAAFSVSTGKSKFGVPLPREGPERSAVLEAVKANPWITCVHVHTGSGGMGLDQLVQGIRVAVEFAKEINQLVGRRQIKTLDMGGGLAVNFKAESPLSSFEAYAAALRDAVPEIFDQQVFDRVITEFGAAVQSKFAFVASRVEYTKTYDGGRIALIHAGSDLFMRACYCPETFIHHRVFTYNKSGLPKSVEKDGQPVPHDIAGPLCFAGDVVVRDCLVPPLQVDDIVLLADAGGNTLSIRTTHCSRQSPPVYVYRFGKDFSEVAFQRLQSTQAIAKALEPWKCA